MQRIGAMLILALVLGSEQSSAQRSWLEVPLPIVNPSLFQISFADSLNGCIAASDGTFLFSSDGGSRWSYHFIVAPYPIRACKLVSPNVGWVVAAPNSIPSTQGIVFKTTDRGVTWDLKSPPDSLQVTAFAFVSATTAFAATFRQLWASTDGGDSWEPRGTFVGNGAYPAVEFFDDSIGYVAGGWGAESITGTPQKTSNGGFSWTNIAGGAQSGGKIPSKFTNGRMGTMWVESIIVATQRTIELTSDKGQTWRVVDSYSPPFSQGTIWYGFALDASRIWLLTYRGKIRRTTNGGSTWQADSLTVPITELLCDDFGHRFALGSGRLFRFDSTATGIRQPNPFPEGFALHQNYPNSFNPTTTIRFTIPKGVETLHATSLQVFDLLGREVATLANDAMEPGEHSVVFDASGLASGVYFYQLKSGGFVSTKKMLLVQ